MVQQSHNHIFALTKPHPTRHFEHRHYYGRTQKRESKSASAFACHNDEPSQIQKSRPLSPSRSLLPFSCSLNLGLCFFGASVLVPCDHECKPSPLRSPPATSTPHLEPLKWRPLFQSVLVKSQTLTLLTLSSITMEISNHLTI